MWSGDGCECGYCGNGCVGLVEAVVIGGVWCGGDSCVVVVELTCCIFTCLQQVFY